MHCWSEMDGINDKGKISATIDLQLNLVFAALVQVNLAIGADRFFAPLSVLGYFNSTIAPSLLGPLPQQLLSNQGPPWQPDGIGGVCRVWG